MNNISYFSCFPFLFFWWAGWGGGDYFDLLFVLVILIIKPHILCFIASNQSVLPNAQVHLPDHEESLSPPELEEEDTPEGNVSSDSDLKNDQLKQEILSHPEGLNPAVQNASNYDLGIMSAMLRSQLGHFEVSESQVQETSHLTNLVSFKPCCLSIILLSIFHVDQICWFCER